MQTSLTYDNVCVPEVYTVYTCNLDDQDPRYDPGKTHTLLSAKKNTQQHKWLKKKKNHRRIRFFARYSDQWTWPNCAHSQRKRGTGYMPCNKNKITCKRYKGCDLLVHLLSSCAYENAGQTGCTPKNSFLQGSNKLGSTKPTFLP